MILTQHSSVILMNPYLANQSQSLPLKKGRRRHSQFDPSLQLPKCCEHTHHESSLPPPKPQSLFLILLTLLVKNTASSDVVFTTSSLICSPLPPSNSASKHTSSSSDNFLQFSSDSSIRRPPGHQRLTVTLQLLLQALTPFLYNITLNLFHLILFRQAESSKLPLWTLPFHKAPPSLLLKLLILPDISFLE